MILELERAIIDPMYQELPTKADKLDMLKNIVSQRRSAARRSCWIRTLACAQR
jgi:hypothetical protein